MQMGFPSTKKPNKNNNSLKNTHTTKKQTKSKQIVLVLLFFVAKSQRGLQHGTKTNQQKNTHLTASLTPVIYITTRIRFVKCNTTKIGPCEKQPL